MRKEIARRTIAVKYNKVNEVELPRGVFLLSLDFELAWGTRNRPAARQAPPFLQGARRAIEGLLELLEHYDISATWATVGALLLTSENNGSPHPWLADPSFADIPPGDAASQPHWYADDIFEQLLQCSTPQEIGCHTLTHLFVDPGPHGREPFRRELQLFGQLYQQRLGKRPTTFIFPKAKMGHFDVLAEEGYRCFRGPESKWFESLPGQAPSAACRLFDARFGCRPRVDRPVHRPEGIWMLPSSQFYSPFMSVGKHVSVTARVKKAIKGLQLAARRRRIYHLWTHPFNLGVRSVELLHGLEQIFQEARRLADASKLDIFSMGEFSSSLDETVDQQTPH